MWVKRQFAPLPPCAACCIINTQLDDLLSLCAGVAESADARDSKSRGVDPPWGFKSPLRHHAFFQQLCDRQIAKKLGV